MKPPPIVSSSDGLCDQRQDKALNIKLIKKLKTPGEIIMNTAKNIIFLVVAAAIASVAAAENTENRLGSISLKDRKAFAKETLVAYDINADQALDAGELEKAVESMYAKRNSAIKTRRTNLEKKGIIAENTSDEGVVTMYPVPQDAVASLLAEHDANQSGDLDATELMGSMKTIRKMSLGPKFPHSPRISSEVSTDQQS